MTVSFDTSSCAKRLSEAGEKPEVAEAHALVLKEFATTALPGKADIRNLCEEIENVRDDIQDLRCEIKDACCELREFRQEVNERFATKAELGHEMGRLRHDIDAMGQKLTVRVSGMLVLATGVAATLGKVL
jgi:uncharacterized coiled-coil DUF342 family protein